LELLGSMYVLLHYMVHVKEAVNMRWYYRHQHSYIS